MVYRKNQRKKSLMVFIVFIMLFILGVTAGTITYAYFSDSAKAENTLNFGKLKIQTGSNEKVEVTLKGNATTSEKLAPTDTVTITGSVGLEDNSVSAYIRMKIDIADSDGTKIISTAFNKAFMKEMAKIKDGSKQWFVVGNYLYLGNAISAGEANDFTYSASCTNTDTLTPANTIKVTDEMLIEEIKGKNITITFTYQAIQSSGLSGNVKENGYTTNNATNISNILAWGQLFSEDYNEIYVNEYATSYVRGDLDETTYKAGAQVSYQMTKSPYNYFTKSANNAGDYVAFGFLPQTIMAEDVYVDENNKAIFNEVEYYLGSDGYLYEKVKENVFEGNKDKTKYSNGEKISQASANSYRYFKLEPVIWQVLTTTTSEGVNSALLLSVSALTASKFGNIVTYKDSTIGNYLNGEFYGKAFGANKALIKETTLKIGKSEDSAVLEDITEYNLETTDKTTYKVFLSSATDLRNVDCGFTDDAIDNVARVKWPTDYAGSNYAFRDSTDNGGCRWWLRSVYSDYRNWYVGPSGSLGNNKPAEATNSIVPALLLSI